MSTPKELRLPAAPDQPALTAQLMQNYRLGIPVSGGSQIATAPNRSTGESEAFSIGTTGRVHKIYPDPKSETGWNVADLEFPGVARHLAAAGNPDGTIDVYASDLKNRIYTNHGSFRSLATGIGNFNNSRHLQVIGLGNDGQAHLVAWQGKFGAWRNDGHSLPAQSVQLAEIATGKGTDNLLRVIGFGLDDSQLHQVAVQDSTGRWSEGKPTGIPGQWHGLVTGNSDDGVLQVLGLGLDGRAYRVSWLRPSDGQWQNPQPLPSGGVWMQLVTGNGNANLLQVIGLGQDGHAYLVASWLKQGHGWQGGFLLPSLSMRLKALAAGKGSNNTLQVVGIGVDGYAYRVAVQDESGNWLQDTGFRFENQTVRLTAITTGIDSDKNLEVIGLGVDGQAYLLGRQGRQDAWTDCMKLPSPSTPLTAIATGRGAFNHLQVVGLGNQCDAYVVARQTTKDKRLTWVAGQKLPGGWQRLPDLAGAIKGIHVGYDQENKPFLIAHQQLNSLDFFEILLNRSWGGISPSVPALYGWSPALVRYSSASVGVHRGVYVSKADSIAKDHRIVVGQTRVGVNGKDVFGRYSTVTAANSVEGYSGIFALSEDDHGVYYLDQGAADPDTSKVKLSQETAVKTMVAGSDAKGRLEVFALSSEKHLYHTSQDSESQTGWETFLKLNQELVFTQLVVGKNPAGYSDVFAVTDKDGLYHIWQDPTTTDWHFDQIDLPKGKCEEFSSYNIQMTVYDAIGVVAANSPVTIISDDPVLLEINGSSSFLDTNHPWEGTTNAAGQVTIAMKIDSLGVRNLKARTKFMPAGDYISIDPSGPTRETLAKVGVDTLLNAKWKDNKGKEFPLLTDGVRDTAPHIAQAVTSAFAVAKKMPTSLSTGARHFHPRNDPRVARYVVGGDAEDTNIDPTAVEDLCYQVDFSSGAPVFSRLDRAQYAAAFAICDEMPAVSNFFGFDVDWGDVFDAIEDGIATLVHYTVDKLKISFCLTIKGFNYVFHAVIDAVEKAFDLAEEVFKAIGAGFDEVYRWLGFIFNWADIIRTKEVIKYSVDQMGLFAPIVVSALQSQLGSYISSAKAQVHNLFKQAREGVPGKSNMLGIQQMYAPALPEQAMIVEHNIVMTGFMNNLEKAPSPPLGGPGPVPSPEAMAAMQGLMDMLDQNAVHFESSDAFCQARRYLADAMTSTDHFVESAIEGVLSLVEGVVLWGIDAVNSLANAILNAASALFSELIHMLKQDWNIPFVSDLYEDVTNSHLTTLDLGALIVAIPATVIYKITHNQMAPFPDEESVMQFKSVFNQQSLIKASGLGSAGASGEAALAAPSPADAAHWQKVGKEVFEFAALATEWYHIAFTASLDLIKAFERGGGILSESFTQALSAGHALTKVLRQVLKCPWPWSNVGASGGTRESFAHLIWIYHFAPLAIDGVFWFTQDKAKGYFRKRIARVSGDKGAIVAMLLGAVDVALLTSKYVKYPNESEGIDGYELATDILTGIPEVLAFARLSILNDIPGFKNGPLTVLVATDLLCGTGVVIVGLIKVIAGLVSETPAPELLFAEAH